MYTMRRGFDSRRAVCRWFKCYFSNGSVNYKDNIVQIHLKNNPVEFEAARSWSEHFFESNRRYFWKTVYENVVKQFRLADLKPIATVVFVESEHLNILFRPNTSQTKQKKTIIYIHTQLQIALRTWYINKSYRLCQHACWLYIGSLSPSAPE